MKTLTNFDPTMCCPTGVCSPRVDPKLVKLAADIAFIKSRGVPVERFILGHQPQAFTDNALVMAEMGPQAEQLPIFLIGNELKAKGPNRAVRLGREPFALGRGRLRTASGFQSSGRKGELPGGSGAFPPSRPCAVDSSHDSASRTHCGLGWR